MTTSLCNWQSCSIPLWFADLPASVPLKHHKKQFESPSFFKYILYIFRLYIYVSSFGLMLRTNPQSNSNIDPHPGTPPLAQPRCKACRNCAGLAVTGATGSPTGRGTVGTGCGTACGSGCRTYLCRCPRSCGLNQGGRLVVQQGFPDVFPNGWKNKVQHVLPNYLKWQKQLQEYYIHFTNKNMDMSFWILVSNLCCFYHLYLYLFPTELTNLIKPPNPWNREILVKRATLLFWWRHLTFWWNSPVVCQ